MNQAQILASMAQLGDNDCAVKPDIALAFLPEYLERMRLTMDQTDCEGLLYSGALLWKLKQR